jgi:hypothetical protein
MAVAPPSARRHALPSSLFSPHRPWKGVLSEYCIAPNQGGEVHFMARADRRR